MPTKCRVEQNVESSVISVPACQHPSLIQRWCCCSLATVSRHWFNCCICCHARHELDWVPHNSAWKPRGQN